MPEAKKRKLTGSFFVFLIFVAAVIGTFFLPIVVWLKIATVIVLVVLYFYLRRGYIWFYRGATDFKNGKWDSAWTLFTKALKAGVDTERQTMIGSAFIQQGDAAFGIAVLDKVIGDPKAKDFRGTAVITRSMGYWRTGEQEKAISTLEDLRQEGYENDNLSINLETYLLERGELRKAKALISENRNSKTENNGLLDNRGWYYIQTQNWKKAKEVYDELIDDRNAKFPEAYLHGAQVSIHDGDIAQAVDRLSWGMERTFSLLSAVTKDYMETLLTGLENPEVRDEFAKAVENSFVDVSSGRPFEGMALAVPFDRNAEGVIKPSAKPSASNAKSSSLTEDEENRGSDSSEDINTDIDDDNREPNTDLDEEDAAIAASYGDDGFDDDEGDLPDTSLDDDDEREPNTDLGDED